MLSKVGPGGVGEEGPIHPKLQAPPPMETCAHTARGSGPWEQALKHTPFPGFPLCQSPCLLRAGHQETPHPPLACASPATRASGWEPRVSSTPSTPLSP